MAIFTSTPAHAQQIICDGRPVESLNFSGATLVQGAPLQPGAIYSYSNVTAGVDARVEIVANVNGAQLATFDNDGLFPRSFNPEVVPNPLGGGFVDVRFSFFQAGTLTPLAIDTSATAIDVDGDNVTLREFVEFEDRYVSFTLNNPTRIAQNATFSSQSSRDRFEANVSTVAPGIDPSAVENAVRAIYTNSTTFEIALGTLDAGTITRLTSVSFDCPSFTNPVITENPDANLVTVKSLSSGNSNPAVGDTVTYQIAVQNAGPGDTTNITLTDILPAGLTATALNGTVSAGTYVSSTGVWTIPSLDNGESAILTLEGTVNNDQGGSDISNIIPAPASSDKNDPNATGDDLTETVTVQPVNVDLTVRKTNTPGVNGDVDQTDDAVISGSNTSYTITITNAGPDDAIGAIVTDVPGAGITCAGTAPVTITGSGVPTGSFTFSDLSGAGITLGTLSTGQTTTLTYSCQVN